MYYRGANAALLLYDITNASSFEDVRGWLEGEHSLNVARMSRPAHGAPAAALELKKNCSPDLIIYIVGAKADLHQFRQVTSDLADRKSTRLNSSHSGESRMPSSA